MPCTVYRENEKHSILWLFVVTCLVGVFGFLAGFFTQIYHHHNELYSIKAIDEKQQLIGTYSFTRDEFLSKINPKILREQVKRFSKISRLAGSIDDWECAKQILKFFQSNRLEGATIKNYTTLLSLPNKTNPNFISILDSYDQVRYTSVEELETHQFYSPYSPAGDVTGEVIFVNYGRPEDYQTLQSLHKTNKTDIFHKKIFLMKQFNLSAAEQYKYAVALNASAILMYPDPKQYNPFNQHSYPESIWLPLDGVRNDAVFWNGFGDPETIGLPSNLNVFRTKFIEQMTIPVQPISAKTAIEILQHLKGHEVPAEWVGGLNITYRIGSNKASDFKVRVSVHNQLVQKTIFNVIGMIKGETEPDRYVIVGNQRDSILNGTVDSASGIGTFLEIVRVLSEIYSKGWKPRRTILFCSWGAEEFNLIGSTEFVEENLKILIERTVAYINVNLIMKGNKTLSVAASPLLYHTIFNASRQLKMPGFDRNETIYDKWISTTSILRNQSSIISFGQMNISKLLQNQNSLNEFESFLEVYLRTTSENKRPATRSIDMHGSYAPFAIVAGIPTIDMNFVDTQTEYSYFSYPLIHTQYDRFEALDLILDPGFRFHQTMTQLHCLMIENLADSLFIPFNLLDYAQKLKDSYVCLFPDSGSIDEHPNAIGYFLQLHYEFNIDYVKNRFLKDLQFLEQEIENFIQKAINFHAEQDRSDWNNPLVVREFNDKLLLLERYFRDHRGLPNNNLKHHLILSPAEFKANSFQWSENLFPALFDEIYHITQAETKEEIQNAFLRIEKYFPILINTIREAGNSLLVSNGFFEHSNYEDSTPQLNKFFDDFKISK
ncbi:Glutamate carboxypeptidase 2 [Sarcoptes scabiei]|uniref:Glutamate carboxypeptidase 2 n=1 Tax=Sarcoptes scabiei TaxID=52283 RepID=A0A834VAK2_SARSC|nr:Glutamate carboxypeptidase 2 [Sarcoptes scabiei]